MHDDGMSGVSCYRPAAYSKDRGGSGNSATIACWVLNMHPVLIELTHPPISILSYHAMIALSVLVGVSIGPRWAHGLEGIDVSRARVALLTLAVPIFVAGRLHYVLNQWSVFSDEPLMALRIWSGGLHAGGAMLALALSTPVVLRSLHLPLGKFADGVTPVIGVCIAVARLGCFLHGCCFGVVCHWPWCFTFPSASVVYQYHASIGLVPPGATNSEPVHALQLYFALAGLLIAAVALRLRRRKRYDGQPALVGLVLFSGSAAALEFLRANQPSRKYWSNLPQLEWTALAMLVASLSALAIVEICRRRQVTSTHASCARQ